MRVNNTPVRGIMGLMQPKGPPQQPKGHILRFYLRLQLQRAGCTNTKYLLPRERNGLMHAYVNRPKGRERRDEWTDGARRISFWAIRMLKVRSFVTAPSKIVETGCVINPRILEDALRIRSTLLRWQLTPRK